MDFKLIIAAILFAVMVIATSAIGIQFYNNCESLHDDKQMKQNRNYLIAILVMAILATIFFMYQGSKHDVTKKLANKYGVPSVPGFQFGAAPTK